MSAIHPQAVTDLLASVLSETGEHFEGIMATYAIDVAKLKQSEPQVDAWIAQLNPDFHITGGGGMSFLNLCVDKDEFLWTGEHRVCEHLCMLAMALGKARWMLPRPMWAMMPGGMPYVGFDLKTA